MSNEIVIIPTNLDLNAEQIIQFLKDKSKGRWIENSKHELEITIDDTTLVLSHTQKNDISFLKAMIMSLILMQHDLPYNDITTRQLKG